MASAAATRPSTSPWFATDAGQRATQVFISSAGADQPFVRHLAAALRQRGLGIGVGLEGAPLTADSLSDLYAAIEAADVFLFTRSADLASTRTARCARSSGRSRRGARNTVLGVR